MHDFRCTSSVDMFYDVLKDGMHHYKETEGGRAKVCKAIEAYGEEQRLEGKAEGELEEKIKTANEMLADNMPVEKITKYTGLSEEKIRSLAKEKKA